MNEDYVRKERQEIEDKYKKDLSWMWSAPMIDLF